MKTKLSIFAVILFYFVFSLNQLLFASEKPVVELTHWWVSPGELDALSVLENAIEHRGGEFEPSHLKNFNEHRMLIIERISLGYLPAITHWLGGNELLELKKLDLLAKLPETVEGQEIRNVIFPEVAQETMLNGELAALPVGMHIWNTAYFNAKIYDSFKLLPPTTWDDLIKQATIFKKAGYIPLAVSDDPWQLGFLLDSILLSMGGHKAYHEIFLASESGIREWRELLISTFETFVKLREFTSPAHNNNSWNKNSLLLAEGKAAIQIMGDFVTGELKAAGKVPGLDFYCSTSPGTENYFFYGVDVFAMLNIQEDKLKQGQKLLFDTVLDPTVQADYIGKKGGLPVRNDVDISALDVCTGEIYSQWLKNEHPRVPLPAGNNRMRMTAFQNAGHQLWIANQPDVAVTVDRLIKTIDALGTRIK